MLDDKWKARNRANVLAWQKANPDKVNEKNRRWRQAHPLSHRNSPFWRERALVNKARYSARKHGLPPGDLTVPAVARIVLLPCEYCGKLPAGGFDHVIPLSRGGPNDVANIVPSCLPCNQSKSDRDRPLFGPEWAARRYSVVPRPGG